MNYWSKKEENTRKAQEHTKKMRQTFSTEIEECAKNTHVYETGFKVTEVTSNDCKIILSPTDSVSAIFRLKKGKTAVLNFASYKYPGGGFIIGSSAQEESLCHASFLYNVLSQFNESYYAWNNEHKNKALYTNRALYSPDVIFLDKEDKCTCDVLTCAAPNRGAAQKYCNVSNEDNYKVLKDRINFVINIAKKEGVDTLILGAFGCGVFKQDPNEVAQIFKESLTKGVTFERVVFAIPDANSHNFKAFSKVFANR